jgi:uncharacterized protein
MPRKNDEDEPGEEEDEEERRPGKRRGLTDEEKQMAMFCHLGALIGGFILPLIIWLMKKEESPFIDKHGKEVLNFSITLAIVSMIGIPLTCGLLILAILPMAIMFHVQGGMAASRGEFYEYPMSFRFIT